MALKRKPKETVGENYNVTLDEKSQGDVLHVCDIAITIPKVPTRNKVFSSSKKKSEQKWTRLKLPTGFNWDMAEEEYTAEEVKWIDEDFERRINGMWFKINGVPTYITGLHYFYLQWCKIDIGYPDYRDRDRRFFLFWEVCVVDPKCFGMIMVKHRREGATYKGAAIILEYVLRTFRTNGGILSKTGADAKEFFGKLVKMFRSLPKFYQPMISGTDNPKTVLEMDKPGERMTKQTRRVQKSEALESKIEWKNTAENSFDSYKLGRFVCDEGGKWEEANVKQNWSVVKPTLSNRVLGKAFYPSTVNEMTRKGGANYKKIWDDSDQLTRDGNGRTKSGLYRYFTPAYDGLEDGADIFIDEYGFSVIETPEKPIKSITGDMLFIGSKEHLQNIRDSFKDDPVGLAEHKRQFPWDIEEAFRVEVGHCSFDSERLYNQLEWNDMFAGKLITRGNFMWKNEFGGDVIFVPSKRGRWLVSWIDPKIENHNKKIYRNGQIYPGNMDLIVSGADPYDHSQTTDGRGSDGAAYVFKMYNPADPDNTYMFISEYVYRPPTVFEFYEDILKQSMFYGTQVLSENNRIGLINWFTEKGFKNYLMRRPESTHTSSSKSQKTLGIPTSGDTVRDSLINMVEAYIVDSCGYDTETGEGGNVYFNKLLEDWLIFDAGNWQKYDATVASGLALLATKKNVKKIKPDENQVKYVRTYKKQLVRN